MFSTLTVISIFTEIFATGILIAGAYTLLKRGVSNKKGSDIYLGILFSLFALYVALTVISQMAHNLDLSLIDQIAIQKWIYFDIAVSSFFLWLFILYKFGYSGLLGSKIVSTLIVLSIAATAVSVFISRFDLIYRSDVIEPLISTSLPVPSKTLWVVLWVLFGSFCASRLFAGSRQARNMLALSLISSLLFLASYVLTQFYLTTADASFLLSSWVLTLFGAIILLVSESIPLTDKLALEPLNIFRTRILYKLIFIFVLLIVVLLEVTTLITINISRDALINAVKDRQRSMAESIAARIELGGKTAGRPDMKFIDSLVVSESGEKRTVYVIDPKGIVVAHPQRPIVGTNIIVLVSDGKEAVEKILDSDSGSLIYTDNDYVEDVSSFARVKGLPLKVIVKDSKWDAYAEIRKVETNSLIFAIAGIILAVMVGIFFARSIERPIKEMISGTEAVRRGDLSRRINISSVDEVGQLASAFNQMTAELKDNRDHFVQQEKLVTLGTMAAGMAHEIKNPLVSLRTFTQLLQQKFDDAEFRKKFASIVPQEIERINKIAEDMLKFGRPTKPVLGRVNVNKVLEEVLELFENECRRNNVRVTTKFASVPDITGDQMQLSQAFTNIILNAIQAMKAGGELTVKTDVGEVIRLSRVLKKGVIKDEEGSISEAIWGEQSEDYKEGTIEKPVQMVFAEITDTGEGIPEENLKTVFDPFYTTKAGGTGMGLPITLRIIEDHKGSIKVKSQMGKGTTFIVTLPQKIEEA